MHTIISAVSFIFRTVVWGALVGVIPAYIVSTGVSLASQNPGIILHSQFFGFLVGALLWLGLSFKYGGRWWLPY